MAAPDVDRVRNLLFGMRRKAGLLAVSNGLIGLSLVSRLHPAARPKRQGIEVIRNVPYTDEGGRDHLLDIYRPLKKRKHSPGVLYVHGGAFRILSKDTHWGMAMAFCRGGYTVFVNNYRLAPRHRFPAAVEDSCRAALWVSKNAHKYGVDADRLVFAGESAGANLVTSLAIACAYKRKEPWARSLYDTGIMPKAVLPNCGMLQVTDPHRLVRRYPHMAPWISDRLIEASRGYLGREQFENLDLADPLVFLERGREPDRPLPPFYACVGTKDPLIDDTRRLGAALESLKVPYQVAIYPNEVHAFHALLWRRVARDCWRQQFRFLKPLIWD